MEFSKSPDETCLECSTVESEDQSSDLVEPTAPNETDASELLATDEQQNVCSENSVSAAEAGTVISYSAETVDEQAVSLPSSPRSDAEDSQPGSLSNVKSTLHEFEALRATVLRELETANEMNDDDTSTVAEERAIFQRLLKSLELGIGEMQVCIVNVCRLSVILISLQFKSCGFSYSQSTKGVY